VRKNRNSPDLYVFVLNSPAQYRDPLGLSTDWGSICEGISFSAYCQLRLLAAIANISYRYSLIAGSAPFMTTEGTYPYQHCVWSCRMTRTMGAGFAEIMGNRKEKGDNAVCDLRDIVRDCTDDACGWCKMPQAGRKLIHDACNSADQPSDFADNATGREIGEGLDAGWAADTECEEGCAAAGVPSDVKEGSDTERPFGPRSAYHACPGDDAARFPL
jgi:hypothetical protein